MIPFEKFGRHQPLNRQAERYARESIPFSLSTLADQAGASCAVLSPLLRHVEAHVFAAERLRRPSWPRRSQGNCRKARDGETFDLRSNS